jgi:transcriptional regulator with XRE-family HTH domain
MTPAQSLRVIRELQGLSQNELAKALRVHPAIIVFLGWETERAS